MSCVAHSSATQLSEAGLHTTMSYSNVTFSKTMRTLINCPKGIFQPPELQYMQSANETFVSFTLISPCFPTFFSLTKSSVYCSVHNTQLIASLLPPVLWRPPLPPMSMTQGGGLVLMDQLSTDTALPLLTGRLTEDSSVWQGCQGQRVTGGKPRQPGQLKLKLGRQKSTFHKCWTPSRGASSLAACNSTHLLRVWCPVPTPPF